MVLIIINDLLLYFTTALVFSITILCLLLQIRGKDVLSRDFLRILIPLFLQMGLTSLENYLSRFLSTDALDTVAYQGFALMLTVVSIISTSFILLNLSRYLVRLLPDDTYKKKIGFTVINIVIVLFIIISFFAVIYISKGNWIVAMDETLTYHFPSGSFIFVAHAITTVFYFKKARGREEEALLRSIAITFFPLIILFPLDMIFLTEFSFKLTYICFSIFSVSIYLFISRNYIRNYEPDPETLSADTNFLSHSELSEREQEIARLLVMGKTNTNIGEILFISVNTVKTHIRRIYSKLQISNRIQLIHMIREFDQKK